MKNKNEKKYINKINKREINFIILQLNESNENYKNMFITKSLFEYEYEKLCFIFCFFFLIKKKYLSVNSDRELSNIRKRNFMFYK